MAIAFDSGSNGNATDTSLTFSHTCSGSDRLLVVGIVSGASDVISGVTYNGVAMTRVNVSNNGNSTAYLYYLLNPAAGSNNIVVTRTSSGFMTAEAASFTGVRQNAQPDASTTNTASATNSCANTLTTVRDGAVHVATYAVDAFPVTSITGATSVNAFMGYSAPKSPAGSSTLTGNSSGGNNAWATVGASFSPMAASASASVSPSSSTSPSASVSPSVSSSASRSISPSSSPSPSSHQETLSVDLVCIQFLIGYADKYTLQNTSYSDKYTVRNTSYSDKYTTQGTTYTDTYTTRTRRC